MASMLQLPVESEACAYSMPAGFRFGAKGTPSSRTIMLAELRELLAADERTDFLGGSPTSPSTAQTRERT